MPSDKASGFSESKETDLNQKLDRLILIIIHQFLKEKLGDLILDSIALPEDGEYSETSETSEMSEALQKELDDYLKSGIQSEQLKVLKIKEADFGAVAAQPLALPSEYQPKFLEFRKANKDYNSFKSGQFYAAAKNQYTVQFPREKLLKLAAIWQRRPEHREDPDRQWAYQKLETLIENSRVLSQHLSENLVISFNSVDLSALEGLLNEPISGESDLLDFNINFNWNKVLGFGTEERAWFNQEQFNRLFYDFLKLSPYLKYLYAFMTLKSVISSSHKTKNYIQKSVNNLKEIDKSDLSFKYAETFFRDLNNNYNREQRRAIRRAVPAIFTRLKKQPVSVSFDSIEIAHLNNNAIFNSEWTAGKDVNQFVQSCVNYYSELSAIDAQKNWLSNIYTQFNAGYTDNLFLFTQTLINQAKCEMLKFDGSELPVEIFPPLKLLLDCLKLFKENTLSTSPRAEKNILTQVTGEPVIKLVFYLDQNTDSESGVQWDVVSEEMPEFTPEVCGALVETFRADLNAQRKVSSPKSNHIIEKLQASLSRSFSISELPNSPKRVRFADNPESQDLRSTDGSGSDESDYSEAGTYASDSGRGSVEGLSRTLGHKTSRRSLRGTGRRVLDTPEKKGGVQTLDFLSPGDDGAGYDQGQEVSAAAPATPAHPTDVVRVMRGWGEKTLPGERHSPLRTGSQRRLVKGSGQKRIEELNIVESAPDSISDSGSVASVATVDSNGSDLSNLSGSSSSEGSLSLDGDSVKNLHTPEFRAPPSAHKPKKRRAQRATPTYEVSGDELAGEKTPQPKRVINRAGVGVPVTPRTLSKAFAQAEDAGRAVERITATQAAHNAAQRMKKVRQEANQEAEREVAKRYRARLAKEEAKKRRERELAAQKASQERFELVRKNNEALTPSRQKKRAQPTGSSRGKPLRVDSFYRGLGPSDQWALSTPEREAMPADWRQSSKAPRANGAPVNSSSNLRKIASLRSAGKALSHKDSGAAPASAPVAASHQPRNAVVFAKRADPKKVAGTNYGVDRDPREIAKRAREENRLAAYTSLDRGGRGRRRPQSKAAQGSRNLNRTQQTPVALARGVHSSGVNRPIAPYKPHMNAREYGRYYASPRSRRGVKVTHNPNCESDPKVFRPDL